MRGVSIYEAMLIVGSWPLHLNSIVPFHWATEGFRENHIIGNISGRRKDPELGSKTPFTKTQGWSWPAKS